jgi:hypothetical protein
MSRGEGRLLISLKTVEGWGGGTGETVEIMATVPPTRRSDAYSC